MNAERLQELRKSRLGVESEDIRKGSVDNEIISKNSAVYALQALDIVEGVRLPVKIYELLAQEVPDNKGYNLNLNPYGDKENQVMLRTLRVAKDYGPLELFEKLIVLYCNEDSAKWGELCSSFTNYRVIDNYIAACRKRIPDAQRNRPDIKYLIDLASNCLSVIGVDSKYFENDFNLDLEPNDTDVSEEVIKQLIAIVVTTGRQRELSDELKKYIIAINAGVVDATSSDIKIAEQTNDKPVLISSQDMVMDAGELQKLDEQLGVKLPAEVYEILEHYSIGRNNWNLRINPKGELKIQVMLRTLRIARDYCEAEALSALNKFYVDLSEYDYGEAVKSISEGWLAEALIKSRTKFMDDVDFSEYKMIELKLLAERSLKRIGVDREYMNKLADLGREYNVDVRVKQSIALLISIIVTAGEEDSLSEEFRPWIDECLSNMGFMSAKEQPIEFGTTPEIEIESSITSIEERFNKAYEDVAETKPAVIDTKRDVAVNDMLDYSIMDKLQDRMELLLRYDAVYNVLVKSKSQESLLKKDLTLYADGTKSWTTDKAMLLYIAAELAELSKEQINSLHSLRNIKVKENGASSIFLTGGIHTESSIIYLFKVEGTGLIISKETSSIVSFTSTDYTRALTLINSSKKYLQ